MTRWGNKARYGWKFMKIARERRRENTSRAQDVAILESMKMEIPASANQDGI